MEGIDKDSEAGQFLEIMYELFEDDPDRLKVIDHYVRSRTKPTHDEVNELLRHFVVVENGEERLVLTPKQKALFERMKFVVGDVKAPKQ